MTDSNNKGTQQAEAWPVVGQSEAIALTVEHIRDGLRHDGDEEEDPLAEARALLRETTPEEVVDSTEVMEGGHWRYIEAAPELRDQLREQVAEVLASPDLCERAAQEGAALVDDRWG